MPAHAKLLKRIKKNIELMRRFSNVIYYPPPKTEREKRIYIEGVNDGLDITLRLIEREKK